MSPAKIRSFDLGETNPPVLFNRLTGDGGNPLTGGEEDSLLNLNGGSVQLRNVTVLPASNNGQGDEVDRDIRRQDDDIEEGAPRNNRDFVDSATLNKGKVQGR